MKYLILTLLLCNIAFAAAVRTVRTTGTVERIDMGDPNPVLPPNVVRVKKSEALERVYKTTDTITTRAATRYRDDGSTITRVVTRTTTARIRPSTYTLELIPDYFYWEPDGKYYRHLWPGEAGYTTPTTTIVGAPPR